MNRLSLLLTLCSALLASMALPASAQSTWQRKTSSSDEILGGIAFGHGVFVSVGDAGTILSSSDATTWMPEMSGTTQALRGVT